MKIVGAGIVIAVFTIFGILRANGLSRHARCLGEIIEALRFMNSELRSAATPLPEMFIEMLKVSKPETKGFIQELSDSMSKLDDISFSKLWYEALQKGNLGLSQNEMIELGRLGLSLGRYPADEQCNAIEVCMSRLEYDYDIALKKAQEGRKLYTGLGLAMGIMFATILI